MGCQVVRAAVGVLLSVVFVGGLLAQSQAPDWERGELITFENLDRDPAVPTAASLLGYEIGEHFTRHADMVGAIKAIAEASDRVRYTEYGQTHQRRPLIQLTISSPANLARLDEILAANRELADPATSESRAQRIIETNPAIVWFSFGVHGNEASCPEAALRVIDTFAGGNHPGLDEILENVVLAIDPSLNPDGHERYVSWYQNTVGAANNTDPSASEHAEPWPGGRTNHYLFDLNRDWLWVVQPESRQRVARYRTFMPQLHIDHHEQGHTNPYFLGPGDEPYNTNIPQRTKDWIALYGKANAEAFDNEGKLYSTKERFDYLYPGYGKVLPVYHGAVGMLLEQAGHSRAGLGIEIDENYTLTLGERSRNHWLIAMSNLQATARHREGQLERFRDYFVSAVEEGQADPWACVISGDTPRGLLDRVWDLCQSHGIEIRELTEAMSTEGLSPVFSRAHQADPTDESGEADESEETVEEVEISEPKVVPAGSWVISTDQAMGRLVKALFEPAPEITDRDTYDVTSWSLPATFGLEAYYTTEAVLNTQGIDARMQRLGQITGQGNVALVIDSAGHNYPSVIASASGHELTARVASKAFVIDGVSFGPGSLIVHALRNQHADLDAFTEEVTGAGVDVHRTDSGLTDSGPVLAANANGDFESADIVLVKSDSMSSLSFGQHWHLLDKVWDLPHTVVNARSLGYAGLDTRSVVVLPSGSVSSSAKDTLSEFVRGGGVLVASGSSAGWAERSLLEIETDDKDDDDAEERPDPSEMTYAERRERSVDDRIPGALLQIDIDTTHPLASGVPASLGVIKSGSRVLRVKDSGYVIARFAEAESLVIGGSISDRNVNKLAGKPWMTAHRLGRGWVICLADDVTFRGFEHGPMRLLLNAILLGPSQ